LSISAGSSRYWYGVYYAIGMIFIYPIGIPLLYFLLLWWNVQDIRKAVKHKSPEEIDEELSETKCLINMTESMIQDIRNDILQHYVRRPTPDEIEISYFVKQHTTNFINYKHLNFLYIAYEPKYWYWEVIETFRRLLFTAFLVMSVSAPNLKVNFLFFIIIIIIFLIILLYILFIIINNNIYFIDCW